MPEKSDAQLLREYAGQKSEPAFGELVRRYADMVYSSAMRQVGSRDSAGEVAQQVFIDLARKSAKLAGQVPEDGSLAGWLYRATRYAALNLLRDERRRQSRERQIMQEIHAVPEPGPDWDGLAPLLDEAMSELSEDEREALLLRFFKNRNFRDVGEALGINDDTAQKRVTRSLEKLRTIMARRGVTTTSAALTATLAANAIQAAPAALTTAWISASLAGATVETGTTLSLLKVMSMTKVQMGISALVAAGLGVTAVVQHGTAQRVQAANVALQQQVATLMADNQALSAQLPAAPVRALSDEQMQELLRLRGEVGQLREQTNALASARLETERLRAENKQLQAQAQSGDTATLRFQADTAKIVNAAKIIGLAARTWSFTNNNLYPTNLAAISDAQKEIPGVPLNVFELVNVGTANELWPGAIFARERMSRPNPQGGWQRIYLLCDGSVQTANVPDDNFDNWEKINTMPIGERVITRPNSPPQ